MRPSVLAILGFSFCSAGAPAAPGSGSTTPTQADVDPIEVVLGPQPTSTCESRWRAPAEPGGSFAEEIVAGRDHTCARLRSGLVRCWGGNANGELGGCTDAAAVSMPTVFAGGEDVVALGVGRGGSCVVTEAGRVACSDGLRELLGASGVGWIDGIENATAVAVGDQHVCALRQGDTALCFGHWSAADAVGPTATVLDDGSDSGRAAGIIGVRGARKIAAGAHHNCVLDGGGQVMCWGRNAQGQLGNPRAGEQLDDGRGGAQRVPGLPHIDDVAADGDETCARSDAGEIFCWGRSFGAQAKQLRIPEVLDLDVGPGFSCVATKAGGVGCIGGALPWLGREPSLDLPGYEDVLDVAVGRAHVCGRSSKGIVLCQGATGRGQLGDGTEPVAQAVDDPAREPTRKEPAPVLLAGVPL